MQELLGQIANLFKKSETNLIAEVAGHLEPLKLCPIESVFIPTKLYKLDYQLTIQLLAVECSLVVMDAMEDIHQVLGVIGLKLELSLETYTVDKVVNHILQLLVIITLLENINHAVLQLMLLQLAHQLVNQDTLHLILMTNISEKLLIVFPLMSVKSKLKL